jgi:hypothetical protein
MASPRTTSSNQPDQLLRTNYQGNRHYDTETTIANLDSHQGSLNPEHHPRVCLRHRAQSFF